MLKKNYVVHTTDGRIGKVVNIERQVEVLFYYQGLSFYHGYFPKEKLIPIFDENGIIISGQEEVYVYTRKV